MIVWGDFILVALADIDDDKGAGAGSRVLRLFVEGKWLMLGNRRTNSFW